MMSSYFKYLSFLLIFFGLNFGLYSQSLNGKLIDSETQKPIPYANIQIKSAYGVISNSEGDFSIVISQFSKADSIHFSSLGYQKKSIVMEDFKGNNIYLTPQKEKLEAVFIQNKTYTAEEIMEIVNENLEENYVKNTSEFTVYRRNKSENTPKRIVFKTKKAKNILDRKTRKKLNKTIDSFTTASKNNKAITYASLLAEAAMKDSLKMKLNKASVLIDRDKNVNLNDYSTEIYSKLATYLKSSNTFQVRTGLLKIGDSVDLAKGFNKKETDIDSVFTKSLKANLSALIDNSLFHSEKGSISISVGGSASPSYIPREFIKNPKKYNYNLEKTMMLGDEFVYQVSFRPKRKGKYEGNLFISTSDFGIYRMEFQLAEGKSGAKFNMKMLLGVKFEEYDQSGLVIYQKLNNFYQPQYIQLSGKQYAFLNRNLTLKENTDQRKDRIKLKMKMTLEFDNAYQEEWLFSNIKKISDEEFASFQGNKGVEQHELTKFDAAFWEGENTLAPTKAVREYDAEKN